MTVMDHILITNKEPNLGLPDVNKLELINGWCAYFHQAVATLGEVTVKIDGVFNTYDYIFKDGQRTSKPSTDEREYELILDYDLFTWWRQSEFSPFALLVLLLQKEKPKTDNLEMWCEVFGRADDEAVNFLLEAVIPGVCGCGSPQQVLASIHELLSGFGGNPIHHDCDFDIYQTGYHLALAYQIDAVGDLIEHGSSIGGSWLEARGVVLCLAIAKYIKDHEEWKK